jgi:hypothetical protein
LGDRVKLVEKTVDKRLIVLFVNAVSTPFLRDYRHKKAALFYE